MSLTTGPVVFQAESRGTSLPPIGSRGVVQSVFRRALNLEFSPGNGDTTLVVVLAPGLPMASWGCRVQELPTPFEKFISVGAPCSFDGQILTVEGCLRVDFSSARVWDGGSLPPGGPVREDVRLGLWRFVRRKKLPGFLRLFAPYHSSVRNDVILGCAGEAAAAMVRARCARDTAGEAEAARHLIGLGPGLTPAGDDFLGGYLAGRFAQSPGGSRDSGVLSFASLLLPYAGETGIVAQAFLRKALAGNFSEYIADLARAAVVGGISDEELQELAEKVIGFGATSGADALAGFLTSCFSTVDFPFE